MRSAFRKDRGFQGLGDGICSLGLSQERERGEKKLSVLMDHYNRKGLVLGGPPLIFIVHSRSRQAKARDRHVAGNIEAASVMNGHAKNSLQEKTISA